MCDRRVAPGVSFSELTPSLAATVVVPWTRAPDSYGGEGERGGCEWAVPPSSGAAASTRRVLFCHGGGYTSCTPADYRGLSSRLAAALGVPVFVFDYRKAPEHPHPCAIDDAETALRFVATHGPGGERESVAASEIIVMGDSAGGGMALGLLLRLQRLAAAGQPPPHGRSDSIIPT